MDEIYLLIYFDADEWELKIGLVDTDTILYHEIDNVIFLTIYTVFSKNWWKNDLYKMAYLND